MRAITNPNADCDRSSQSYPNSDIYSDADANGYRGGEPNPDAYSNAKCHRSGESYTDSNCHCCREPDSNADAHSATPRALTSDRKFKSYPELQRRCKTGSGDRQDGGQRATPFLPQTNAILRRYSTAISEVQQGG